MSSLPPAALAASRFKHPQCEIINPYQIPPKRLRGGNNDEDYEEDIPEDFFPDDVDETYDYDNDNDINQSSNLSWTDQTDTATEFSQLSPQQLQRWSRKPLPKDFDNQKDLHFQWLDIDMTQNPKPLEKNPNSSRKNVLGSQVGNVPVIRIYGVTDEGHSIMTFLHGYTPYGYFALPEGYKLDCGKEGKNAVLGKIRAKLNDLLRQSKTAQRGGDKNNNGGDLVQGVQYVDDRKSIMGYNTAHTKFLKVYVQMPTLIPTLKRVMEGGVTLPHIVKLTGGDATATGNASGQDADFWDESGSGGQSYQPFECNVPFVLRFMIDEDVNGAGWITLPKDTYQLRTEKNGLKASHCQVRNVNEVNERLLCRL